MPPSGTLKMPAFEYSFAPVLARLPWFRWLGDIPPERVGLQSHAVLHIGCDRCKREWRPRAYTWHKGGHLQVVPT
jgi:hypothetical protein